MSITPQPSPTEPRDRRRAGRAGAPSLVRVAVPLPDRDPWTWLEALAAPGERVTAWSAAGGGASFVAAGAAAGLHVAGPGRIAAAEAFCSEVREQLLAADPAPAGAPLVLAGLAFEARGAPRTGPWAGWDDGLLHVPAVLVRRDAAGTRAVLAAPLGPGASPDEVAAGLRARAARLAAAAAPAAPSAPPHAVAEAGSTPDRPGWEARVAALVDRLRTPGEALAKVVLARAAAFRARPGHHLDPWGTARALRARHRGATVFAVRAADGSVFTGATPELLVRTRGVEAETVALAGTARRAPDPREDAARAAALSARAKDLHEHRLVVEAIEEALAPLAEAVAVESPPRLRSLADVHHLETPVRARLAAPGGLWPLVGRLHPTPAVGGWPRAEALTWLDAHEGLDRGWYAGALGFVDAAGDGELHVPLRCALLRGDEAWAFVGAGVVAASDPAAEWEETADKLEAVRQALVSRPAPGGAP